MLNQEMRDLHTVMNEHMGDAMQCAYSITSQLADSILYSSITDHSVATNFLEVLEPIDFGHGIIDDYESISELTLSLLDIQTKWIDWVSSYLTDNDETLTYETKEIVQQELASFKTHIQDILDLLPCLERATYKEND